MIDIVIQTIDFYFKHLREPLLSELQIPDEKLLAEKGCVFVTLYKNGEIRWSAWNIKEIEENIVKELIKSTIEALTKDSRFSPVKIDEYKTLRIRVDKITEKKVLEEGHIESIDPLKHGVVTIKKDYSKLAVILPNISAKLITGKNLITLLESKLSEVFHEIDYIIYEITTKTEENF
jgi:AMMECR1 domain-containing protein